VNNARERRERAAKIAQSLAKSKAAEAAMPIAPPEPPAAPPPPPEPEPLPEIREPLTMVEQVTLAAFALFVAVMSLLAAYFTDNRQSGIDELVMYSPAYMLATYGNLTDPAEGFFDAPITAHPPIHIGSIGLLRRLGFTWYYAGGTPIAFFLLLSVWIVVRSRFDLPVKIGLLFGVGFYVATALFFVAPFGTRPDSAVQVIWFAGLVLLESGRLDGWSLPQLCGGAFVMTWASCTHYYALPSLAGIAVYVIWAFRSLGWRRARKRILALIGGVLLFAAPYLAFYVRPYWHNILDTIRERGLGDRTGASAMSQHMAFYKYWATAWATPDVVKKPMALGIPLILFSSAILGAIRRTRGIAMAAAPLQLAIFFFATHKRSVYLVHEIEIFVTALAVGAMVLVYRLGHRPSLPGWCRPAVLPVAVLLLCVYLVHADSYFPTPVLSIRPQIHEADVARAATRQLLGPHARVCGRDGAWYSSGGEYWHDNFVDLVWDPTVDPVNYLARFDAAADFRYRSGDSRKGTLRGISYWYYTGLVKLRGFYMSQCNAELRLALFSLNRPAKVSGYALRDGLLYRFDESESGQREVITAACPAGPEVDWGHLYPWASVVPLDLPPMGPAAPGGLVIALTPLNKPEPAAYLERTCKVIGRIRGDESPVDQYALVDTLRRTDTPIHFAPSLKDVPASQP